MLDSLSSGFLKRDVLRYTKPNGIFAEALGTFSDVQLLRLKMDQVHVLPQSRRKISQCRKHSTNRASKEAQSVSNSPSCTTPKITRTILTMGKILNPHGTFEISPALSLWEGSWVKDLQTWRNPGGPISDMSVKSLTPQQDKARAYNLENAPKFADGKRISTKSIESIKKSS